MKNANVRRISLQNLPKAANYSHAVVANRIIFVSGVTGQNETKTTLKSQFDEIVRRISAVLSEGHSSIEDVVKVTAYLSDAGLFNEFNELFNKTFISAPARTTIVCGFSNPRVKVELDLVALES